GQCVRVAGEGDPLLPGELPQRVTGEGYAFPEERRWQLDAGQLRTAGPVDTAHIGLPDHAGALVQDRTVDFEALGERPGIMWMGGDYLDSAALRGVVGVCAGARHEQADQRGDDPGTPRVRHTAKGRPRAQYLYRTQTYGRSWRRPSTRLVVRSWSWNPPGSAHMSASAPRTN